MSYFICKFGSVNEATESFAEILRDIAPDHVNHASVKLESGVSSIRSFGGGKAIPDFTISDERSGSWLALLGTPLVRVASQKEALALLTEFAANPNRVLREKLDGNFAAFCYDAERGRLIVATDFNSTIPVFYCAFSGGVLLASHELGLARLTSSGVDPHGFAQAIHLGVTWGPHTRFRNIRKLQACEVRFFGGDGRIRTEYYWRPQEESMLPGDLEQHIENWLPVLKKAVWQYYDCSGQKPAIADFTAGEDGRLLVAQCHALRIAFRAHVTGLADDTDVVVAKKAAAIANFQLIVREQQNMAKDQLLENALKISLRSDAYQDFFKCCTEFATDLASPLDDYGTVKYCGVPGGEAFRGSYYLRGKAVRPCRRSPLDSQFFTKMKYLLDFQPGLLKGSDEEFLDGVHGLMRDGLEETRGFPVGTQIDHVLRLFQTCLLGLKYKNPVYLPYATQPMTRSIYWLSPRYKRAGKLTRACTEKLFPKLAKVRTQNGVPTIRKTMLRLPLFVPEYVALAKKIGSGAFSRLLKWTRPNKWYYSDEWTAHIFTTLLNERPYCQWFSSPEAMATGHLYQPDAVGAILREAKSGTSRHVPVLSRIINNELAYRWVSHA